MSGLLKSELVGPGLNAANRNGTGEASARRRWMLTEMRLRSRCELHRSLSARATSLRISALTRLNSTKLRQLPFSGSLGANGDNVACNRPIVVLTGV